MTSAVSRLYLGVKGAVPNLLTKTLPSSVGVTLPGVGPLRDDV